MKENIPVIIAAALIVGGVVGYMLKGGLPTAKPVSQEATKETAVIDRKSVV